MSSNLRSLLLISFGITALILSLPISNLLTPRTYFANDEDEEFKEVSDILVKKCADCHTQDLAKQPLYFGMPVAEAIIHRNITRGRAAFLLNKAKLSGKENFTSIDLEKLSSAMAKNNMPPKQYLLLHWDSALNEEDQKRLVTWIKKRSKVYDIRPIPKENFFKPDLQKAALGKKLFADKRLSSDNSHSCASCHNLDKGGCDNLQYSISPGGQKCDVNTPTVLNAAYNITQYWDGHAKSLKEQVGFAIRNPQEMASNWQQAIENLNKQESYKNEFKNLYPEGITPDSVSDAVSQYEHTLLTPGSRFDKFLQGDQSALSAEEKEGFEVFKKHECYDCHSGPALGGISYEIMGYSRDYFTRSKSDIDNGRFNVTHRSTDMHRFKVPTLRNIELTYPYMHDGSAPTLEAAVKVMSDYQVDKPLTESERKKVVAFLKSLTGTSYLRD